MYMYSPVANYMLYFIYPLTREHFMLCLALVKELWQAREAGR